MEPETTQRGVALSWLRGASVVAIGMAVQNAAAYGFTLIAVHALAPEEFGALTAILGLILIGNVVSLGLQATGARRVATHSGEGADVLAGTLLHAGRRAAAGMTVLCLLATPLIMWLLHIDDVVAVLLLAPNLGLLTVMGSQLGVMQGAEQWRRVATVYAAQGIGRVCFGAIGLMIWPDLTGAMAGIAVGVVVPVLIASFLLRGPTTWSREQVGQVVRETLHGTHTLLAFFAIANTDILLARAFLDGRDSGIYAAGVIIAKAGLFLPQFVIVVVFPSLATAPDDTRRLKRAIVAIGGIAACATVGAWLLPDLVVTIVGGDEYAAIGPIAWLFAITGSAYAILQLVVYAAIAQQERRAAPAIWIGLGVLVITAVIVLGLDLATGTTGVKALAATTSSCALLLAIVLATGLHKPSTATDQPRPNSP